MMRLLVVFFFFFAAPVPQSPAHILPSRFVSGLPEESLESSSVWSYTAVWINLPPTPRCQTLAHPSVLTCVHKHIIWPSGVVMLCRSSDAFAKRCRISKAPIKSRLCFSQIFLFKMVFMSSHSHVRLLQPCDVKRFHPALNKKQYEKQHFLTGDITGILISFFGGLLIFFEQ